MIQLTIRQARQFLLLKHGLLDAYKFSEKQGVMDYVRQVGCIQFDPIDVCGKNAELVLQSRVTGFKKKMLSELLYEERQLFDYPDKNLSILPVGDWPYFERYRKAAKQHAKEFLEMEELTVQVRNHIRNIGEVCSNDLQLNGDFSWQSVIHWSGGNNVSRSVLEQMYSTGELIIHHKKGTRKYYDLADKHIQQSVLEAPEPLVDDMEHLKWRVLRRIGAVGLLWNRASDAWLNIWGLKAAQRHQIFWELVEDGHIVAVKVEQVKDPLYCLADDEPLIEYILEKKTYKKRCELIAPLDNIIWDRRLINILFNFDYTWEIYTPLSKRKYGHYVLPILFGEHFIGRVEAIVEKKTKTLIVKNIWYEEDVKQTNELRTNLNSCFKRFAVFNECEVVVLAFEESS